MISGRGIRAWLAGTALLALTASCEGILGGVYDNEPEAPEPVTGPGTLYVDASDWTRWYYIDLVEVVEKSAADPQYNTSESWKSFPIPGASDADGKTTDVRPAPGTPGIYTYWYDVFGQGTSVNEFRTFMPTGPQPAPERWSLAVHRNNVRTNGGEAAITTYTALEQLPEGTEWTAGLEFRGDEFNETDVWVAQGRMLTGLIGNEGIAVNPVLSGWLELLVPPMPPAFVQNSHVYVLRMADGTMGALQLADYMNQAGVKCCLTIRYKYPL